MEEDFWLLNFNDPFKGILKFENKIWKHAHAQMSYGTTKFGGKYFLSLACTKKTKEAPILFIQRPQKCAFSEKQLQVHLTLQCLCMIFFRILQS